MFKMSLQSNHDFWLNLNEDVRCWFRFLILSSCECEFKTKVIPHSAIASSKYNLYRSKRQVKPKTSIY